MEELIALIKGCGFRYSKVLTCARDVFDALGDASAPPPPPVMPWKFNVAAFTGINVIISPDAAPGTWRLVQHDHCEVIESRRTGQEMIVTHRNCTILGEHPERADAARPV